MAAIAAKQLLDSLDVQTLEPREALHHAAQTYLEYAKNHPRLYTLLMQPQPSQGTQKELWNKFLALIGAITHNPDDTESAVAFWAFLHGYASLEQNGAFGSSGAGNAFETGLETWLRGLA